MRQLNLPQYDIRLKNEREQSWVYDEYRKKFVVLTPEEWVRQHFLNYLIAHLNYPKSLIKVESGININKMGRRTDILVYDREASPFMLVECKAAKIAMSQAVFDQISNYNQAYQAKYLVVTNGIKHYCCEVDYSTNQYQFLKEIPTFN